MTFTVHLPDSLAAVAATDARERIQTEIRRLPSAALPLQQGLAHSSCVSDEPFSVMIIEISPSASAVRVKTGIFYSGIVAGCSCADDPTPLQVQPEYCELLFTIDRMTAQAEITLL